MSVGRDVTRLVLAESRPDILFLAGQRRIGSGTRHALLATSEAYGASSEKE